MTQHSAAAKRQEIRPMPLDASFSAAINAADHGLRRDGGDMTAPLQAAFRAGIEAGRPVFMEPGVYEAGDLVIDGPLALLGAPGGATLRLRAGAGSLLRIAHAGPVKLDGLGFDGGRQGLSGGRSGALLAAEAANGHVMLGIGNCTFANSGGSALSLRRASGEVRGCTITGCADAAIFSLDARELLIADNRVHDCGNNGILVWRSRRGEDGTCLRGNRISAIHARDGGSGQNGNGISIFRADGVTVEGNRIEDCEFSAIRANASSSVVISANACRNLREVAIYFEHTGGAEAKGAQAAVISGNLVENCAHGISLTNFDNAARLASCTGNLVRRCTVRRGAPDARGVGISAEADTIISGNTVEDAEIYGIVLGTGDFTRNVSAAGNIVVNNDGNLTTQAGICVSGSPRAGAQLVSANLIRMKPSRGSAYGLVALDGAGAIVMAGPFPQPVTADVFPGIAVSGNSISS
jgi:uncharacterized secreted repeat protein (TIGR03808 family)